MIQSATVSTRGHAAGRFRTTAAAHAAVAAANNSASLASLASLSANPFCLSKSLSRTGINPEQGNLSVKPKRVNQYYGHATKNTISWKNNKP
jgi:hypothetical protein